MKWYVLRFDEGVLKPFNVFNSRGFKRAVKEEIFSVPERTLEEVDSLLRDIARTQFWGRAEYELLLYTWPKGINSSGHKYSVFEQLELNWDRFAEYVYDKYCFGEELNG